MATKVLAGVEAIGLVRNVGDATLRRRRRRTVILIGELIIVGIIVGVWEIASTRTTLVPSVTTTTEELYQGLFSEGDFLGPLWWSMQAVLEGFGIAAVAAVLVGLLLGRSRFWGAVFDPILTMFYVIPRIILYPVIIGFLGITMQSERWMAILSSFFPMAINAIAGVRDVTPTLTKLGRSLSCSPLQMARHIFLPAAAPALMVGLRIGWSSAFVIVILSEFFAARKGLGLLMIQSYNVLQYATMFALVLLTCLVALVGNLAIGAVERRVQEAAL